jgi:hypothetical protein
MADLTHILPNTVQPAGNGARIINRQPDSLRTAEDARIRAGVLRESDSPRLKRALSRLDKVLEADSQPNASVPRGFYINIEV